MPYPSRAKRSLGQNFLIDPNYRRKIVTAVREHSTNSAVMEIGPGRGALTEGLAGFAASLVLVEKDRELAVALKERWRDRPSVSVIHGDFLPLDLTTMGPGPGTVVANLPYNVASQILLKLLRNMRRFNALILMFQKEVARRCTALAGADDYGVLSVWCHLLSHPKKLFDVPPTAFKPQPKVTSSVVLFLPGQRVYDEDVQAFMDFVRLLFSQRRKKIGSVLKRKLSATAYAGVFTTHADFLERRVETLTLAELESLHHGCFDCAIPSRASSFP